MRTDFKIINKFIDKYFPDKRIKVLDLGSKLEPGQELTGTYRQLMANRKWSYVGVDTEKGTNVSKVIRDNKLPYLNGEFDYVISGSFLDHTTNPKAWLQEISRVLKPGGMFCTVALASARKYKTPKTTFGINPDGMKTLAKWGNLEVIEARNLNLRNKITYTYLIATKLKPTATKG